MAKFDVAAFLKKCQTAMAELPDPDDFDDDDAYAKALGAIDITEANKDLGVLIFKRRSRGD